MNNELLLKNLKSNNSEVKSNNEEKQIEEMAEILKAYTKKNNIMASHVILECYAEELYSKNYRKQSESTMSQVKQSEWISVEDRLPEKSGDYLTYHKHGSCGVIYYNADIKLWNVYYSDDVRNAIRSITHWMPLPEAPKMKNTEN
jgi:hypothetical protein